MGMTKWAYYADFVVYPVLIAGAALHALWHASSAVAALFLAAMGLGLVAWTGVEYVLHRWVLHRLPPFKRLHALHHERPFDLIGTPTWLSAALFVGLWWLLARETPAALTGGATTGLMAGYLGYVAVHDAVHHRRAQPGSWLHQAKLRHARHHQAGVACNFGVSNAWWDAALGTQAAQGTVVTKDTSNG